MVSEIDLWEIEYFSIFFGYFATILSFKVFLEMYLVFSYINYILFTATTIPPACVPQHILAAPDYSEDCLYLNLFSPTIENKKRTVPTTSEQHKFPILVFIHGGGFCVGGTFLEVIF